MSHRNGKRISDSGGELLPSTGRPLDAKVRAYFEPRFGWDFSRIRIHSDDEAAQSAKSIGARVNAVGTHIAFGPGEYAPHTASGRSLLAHELAHVVQNFGLSPVLRRKPKGISTADQSAPRDVSRQLGVPLTEEDMLQLIIKSRAEPLGESISLIWKNKDFLLELAKREFKLSMLQEAKSVADWNEHLANRHGL